METLFFIDTSCSRKKSVSEHDPIEVHKQKITFLKNHEKPQKMRNFQMDQTRSEICLGPGMLYLGRSERSGEFEKILILMRKLFFTYFEQKIAKHSKIYRNSDIFSRKMSKN